MVQMYVIATAVLSQSDASTLIGWRAAKSLDKNSRNWPTATSASSCEQRFAIPNACDLNEGSVYITVYPTTCWCRSRELAILRGNTTHFIRDGFIRRPQYQIVVFQILYSFICIWYISVFQCNISFFLHISLNSCQH